jgi:hypothetical protein
MSLAKSLTRVSTLVDLRLYRKCTRALTNQNLSVDEGVAGGGEGGGKGGIGGRGWTWKREAHRQYRRQRHPWLHLQVEVSKRAVASRPCLPTLCHLGCSPILCHRRCQQMGKLRWMR